MGSNHSSGEEYSQEGLKRFHQNFDYLKNVNDERFGTNISVYREKSSSKLIGLISKSSEDLQALGQLKSELLHRKSLDHENLMRVVGYSKKESDTMCGVGQKITVFHEYFEYDLDLELKERASKREYFSEAELWYMADSLVSVGAFLQTNGMFHGDLRPVNIFMNEDGQVLVTDHGLVHPLRDNWHKALGGNKAVYLTPKQMEALRNRSAHLDYDVFKADVYSLGLTLTQAANLDYSPKYFDDYKLSINNFEIDNSINEAEKRYSKELGDFLRTMTDYDEYKRPDFLSLQKHLEFLKQQEAQSKQTLPYPNPNQNLASYQGFPPQQIPSMYGSQMSQVNQYGRPF